MADLADLALAAEQAAATKACLDMTTEYAKIRYSFGQPIGIYQGVKHPLADIYTDWALTDAAVRKASESLAEGSPTASLDAATARMLASSGYVEAAKMTMLVTWSSNPWPGCSLQVGPWRRCWRPSSSGRWCVTTHLLALRGLLLPRRCCPRRAARRSRRARPRRSWSTRARRRT